MIKKKVKEYIKIDSNGKYYCDIKIDGYRIRKRTETKSQLEAFIKSELNYIKNQKILEPIEQSTIKSLYEKYKFSKINNWTASSQKNNDSIYKNYISLLEKYDLDEINIQILEDWKNEIKKKFSKEYKENFNTETSYMLKIYNALYNILNYAKKEKLIKQINIEFLRKGIIYKQKENFGRDFITLNEMKIISNHLENENKIKGSLVPVDYMHMFLRLLFFTGCRINEARAIKPSDIIKKYHRVNEKTKVYYQLMISKQLKDNLSEEMNTKTKSVRFIFLEDWFYFELIDFIKNNDIKNDEYLFKYPNTSVPLTRKVFTNSIRALIKDYKKKNYLSERIPDNLHPHCFRYSNTLYWKSLGVPYTLAAYMHGHSPSLMLQTYDRIDNDDVLKTFGRLVED